MSIKYSKIILEYQTPSFQFHRCYSADLNRITWLFDFLKFGKNGFHGWNFSTKCIIGEADDVCGDSVH